MNNKQHLKKVKQSTPKRIEFLNIREHSKASEKYVDVIFCYEGGKKWEGSVPIEYRRTGTFAKTSDEMAKVIKDAYESMHPSKEANWLLDQDRFWKVHNKKVTQAFFDGLKDCKWKCVGCQLPQNPNWARRVQDIKEFGYTLATDTKKFCPTCDKNTTHLIMLRLPRSKIELGYETWSPKLRKKILKVLGNFDSYENRASSSYSLLPDHKFPEIRWDEKVHEENPEDMTDKDIRKKFQLLSNQRNQQKREICRNCFQTGKRGAPFGISFFYKGNALWPENIPNRGRNAEEGCIGCGWYDLLAWRNALNDTTARIKCKKRVD